MSEPTQQADRTQTNLEAREAALNRIASEHYAFMYRVAHRILRNSEEAEEALHNAWLNLCRADRLPPMRDERAYLGQAVRREAILRWKKHRRFPAAEEGSEMLLHDTRPTAEQAASGLEVQARIDTLSSKERAVVTLWYREGLSLVEIADVLHLPEGTVRRRFLQAKAHLKPMFAARQPAGQEVVAGERSL